MPNNMQSIIDTIQELKVWFDTLLKLTSKPNLKKWEIIKFGQLIDLYKQMAIQTVAKSIHNSKQRQKIMIVELDGDFMLPLPFASISQLEKQAIQRIHYNRIQNDKLKKSQNNHPHLQPRHLLGQMKLSDRQTIIILCYLLTSMNSSKFKTIFYLCNSNQRVQWVLKAIDKLMIFLEKALSQRQEPHYIKDIKVYQFQKDLQQKIQKDKAVNKKIKRFFVMPLKKYMELQLQIKELLYWQNNQDPSIQLNQNECHFFYKFCKNIDYLFAQTNDLQGVLQEVMSVCLSQTILNRAWIQLMKLNKFYNFRLKRYHQRSKGLKKAEVKEEKEVMKVKKQNEIFLQSIQTKVQNKQQAKRQNSETYKQTSATKEKYKTEQKSSQKPQFKWHVQKFDVKFTKLAEQIKKELQEQSQDIYGRRDRSASKYLQCHYLIQLQAITHLVGYMITSLKQKDAENHNLQISAAQYILTVCRKICIHGGVFKKFKRILKTFVAKFPPIIFEKEITIFYLSQVLDFFEKLVVWNQIFTKTNVEETKVESQASSTQFNNTDFWVFRFKYEYYVQVPLLHGCFSKKVREMHHKLTTFDQRIMFQLLFEGVRSLSCYQNQGYQYSYFEQFFKANTKLNLDYRCPKIVERDTVSATIGLIVKSTPNDEDLHIQTDKPGWYMQHNDIEDKNFDKQNYSQIIRAYGVLIHDICQTVSDGMVVYFPTRQILRQCRAQWQAKENIYQRIYLTKRIFQEEQEQKNNTANLKLFKRLCDNGRGALFLVSTLSQFGKIQTFFGHYSKCIVFLGVPNNPIKIERECKLRQIKQKQLFKVGQSMRLVSRCLSNCINNNDDLKLVLFADASFGNYDIRKKWFPFIEKGTLNSLDVIQKVRGICSKTYQFIKQRKNLERQLALNKQAFVASFRQ